jgi:MscS family membrane protein
MSKVPARLVILGAWTLAALASAGPNPSRAAESVSTPRKAMRGYFEAARAGDHGAAARFLDLEEIRSQNPGVDGPDLARKLQAVLDQKLWIDVESLSDSASGERNDGLPPDRELLGEAEIALRRGIDAAGDSVWRFSPSTVRRVPALYEDYGYGRLGDLLPRSFFVSRFLEVQLWQWIGLPLILLGAFIVSWMLVGILYRVVRRVAHRTRTTLDDLIIDLTRRPSRALVTLALFAAGLPLLRLAAPAFRVVKGVNRVLAVVIVTWLVIRLLDVFVGAWRERLRAREQRSGMAVLSLASKTAKALIVLLAGIAMLQNFGVNVTGLLAGLGVGGIALALAAQKTVENLFGGVSLAADQPVRVGDFCKFGTQVGTVEDIGLRSTRIRTLDRTIITVPNAEFAQVQIENYAARDRIRLLTTLNLRYETTPEQLRRVLEELRKLLLAHPKVHPDPARVRFVRFGAYSLDVEVFAYILTRDYNEYLAVQEELYLSMMDLVKACGTGLAFPSQTLYLERDQHPADDDAPPSEAPGPRGDPTRR